VAGALIAVGIADLVARAVLAAPNLAVTDILNDPAKHFFHVVVLPAAAFVLVRYYPPELKRRLAAHRVLVLSAAACFVVVGLGFTVSDASNNLFRRLTTPEDVADLHARTQLADLRGELIAEWNTDLKGSLDEKTKDSQARERSRKLRTLGTDLLGGDTSFGRFVAAASSRKWFATLCTALGATFVVLVFASIAVVAWGKGGLPDATRRFFLLVVLIPATWVPLKVYSEWYHNLGFYPADDPALVVVGIVTLLAIVLLLAYQSQFKSVNAVVSTVGLLSTAFVTVAHTRPDWLSAAGSNVCRLPTFALVTLYIVVIVAAAGYVRYALQHVVAPEPEGANARFEVDD
jgi:hypothetical protein